VSAPGLGTVYQFGDFRLDCGRFELLRKSHPVRIERKPMELLILLASREGQLVTRSEIALHLWSGEVFVDTEHGINTAIRHWRLGSIYSGARSPVALANRPDAPRCRDISARGAHQSA
jgi:DNA-binding response OmpR family regulator